MKPLRHGYTNHTIGDASTVVKNYRGPDADLRQAREHAMLQHLRGHLPVPEVRSNEPGALSLTFLPGSHGQDLIESGHAAQVLRACGELLRSVHAVDIAGLELLGVSEGEPGRAASSGSAARVLIHGDFGPNNVLLDPATFAVTGLLDWEFARVGSPIEDLAWCEWIVRTHHAAHRDALAEFYAGYGACAPAWTERQATMVDRCLHLREFCLRWDADPASAAARMWAERAEAAGAWTE